MTAAPLICLRRCRRPIVAVAVCLLLWQALAADLFAADAAVLAGYDAGVICHSDAGGSPASGSPADHGDQAQNCCTWCTVASTPVLPAHAPDVVRSGLVRAGGPQSAHEPVLAIAHRAVRAGWSPAPPREA